MDIQKTRSYYNNQTRENVCQCDYCQNFIDEVKGAYPEVAEYLADKRHTYLVGELRSNALGIGKAHYVVNCLDGTFAAFARRGIIVAPCVLLVNHFHLRVGILGLGHAVYRDRQNSLVSLVGVQYVSQRLLDVTVDSHRFTVRQSSC